MAATKKTFWILARKVFRWCRIVVWLVLLVLVVAAVYFNTIGLPDFIKRPLLAKIREQGWEVEFTNMRWPWYREITIENPSFNPVEKVGPSFSAARAELSVHWSRKTNWQIRSLTVDSGDFRWTQTNRPPVRLERMKMRFLFHPDGRLEVTPFQAQFRDAKIMISGVLSNATALAELSSPASTNRAAKTDFTQILDELERIKWKEARCNLAFHGDARELHKLRAEFTLSARRIETKFGHSDNLTLQAFWNAISNAPPLTAGFSAGGLETPLAGAKNVSAKIEALPLGDSFETWSSDAEIVASNLKAEYRTNLVHADSAQLTLQMVNSIQKVEPLHANGNLQLMNANVHCLKPQEMEAAFAKSEIKFAYDPITNKAEVGVWEKLRPFTFLFSASGNRLAAMGLQVTNFDITADWRFPKLTLQKVNVESAAGELAVDGSLDVESRHFQTAINSEVDLATVRPLFPRDPRHFLEQFDCSNPPKLDWQLSLTLPPWTEAEPNWFNVLPTLKIDGTVSGRNISFRKMHSDFAEAEVHLTNRVWNLPKIHVVRPEGELDLAMVSNERTLDFHFLVNSSINPQIISGQLRTNEQQVLSDFQFTQAPKIKGEISGRWMKPESVVAKAEVSATNFTFRNTPIDSIHTDLQFANGLLIFSDPNVEKDSRHVDAQEIKIDFNAGQFFFTNLDSSIDANLIGKVLRIPQFKVLEPFEFSTPPHVKLNGNFKLNEIKNADMRFSVSGTNFHWLWFDLDQTSADLHWLGEDLFVTNAMANAYGNGQLNGWASLHFSREKMNYQCNVTAQRVEMAALLRSLHQTNQVEGLLNGNIFLDTADSAKPQTAEGGGHFEVHDGLIWELPVFGIFSPVLDAILPGFGKSRAREATGDFIITNGVIASDNVEIRASTFRMQYRGKIDLQQQVSGRVNAEILRDTWAIGQIVSLALTPLSKIFEYKISGTLKNPKIEPVYVPKILMMTLRPFHTVKRVFTENESSDRPPDEASKTAP